MSIACNWSSRSVASELGVENSISQHSKTEGYASRKPVAFALCVPRYVFLFNSSDLRVSFVSGTDAHSSEKGEGLNQNHPPTTLTAFSFVMLGAVDLICKSFIPS